MSYRSDSNDTPQSLRDRGQRYCADPWDVNRGENGHTKAAALDRRSWWLLFAWLLVVAALTLTLVAEAWTQAAPPRPPDDDSSPGRVRVVLKSDARELAGDYLAFLNQIQVLSEDYDRYFSDFHQEHAEKLQEQLRKISLSLSDSAYFSDFTQLNKDLAQLHRELRLQEEELAGLLREKAQEKKSRRSADVSSDLRICRLTSSLLRELDMLNTQLEEDITERFAADKVTSAIVQQYIKAAIVTANIERAAGQHAVVVRIGQGECLEPLVIELDLKELEGLTDALEDIELYEIGAVPAPSMPPRVHRLPGATIVSSVAPPPMPLAEVGDKRIVYHHKSGETGLRLQIVDSTRTTSAITPIYVMNSFGSLEIEGWDRDWILVSAEIEIAAEAPDEAEILAERIDLRIHNKSNAVYVETVLPQLTDPQTRVVSATVEIKAPTDNPLNCRNSHGRVYVAGFDNGVKLNANHCDVDMRGIVGGVEVVNSMGRLIISDVSGRMELRNAYELLEVSRCKGPMTIENAFARIELSNCSGNVRVRNSGAIDVSDHTGDLEIDNNNGLVMVRNLEGNLQVASSLHPVVIENIRGSAGLENVRGAIRIDGVEGPLAASSVYGSITASALSGPLHLVSSNGMIELALDRPIAGQSSIMTDYGDIKLKLRESSDLLLTVEALGGDIQSALPFPIRKTDSSHTSRIELGRMVGSLDVSARGADVVISTSH